ncbi:transglycosylase SLT domain-containing protein [Candidatus Woesearchaeota archaeon]|nr:transglycosylase SLT domain-containing protein [Candidatus Woesearchaeota archaeon]
MAALKAILKKSAVKIGEKIKENYTEYMKKRENRYAPQTAPKKGVLATIGIGGLALGKLLFSKGKQVTERPDIGTWMIWLGLAAWITELGIWGLRPWDLLWGSKDIIAFAATYQAFIVHTMVLFVVLFLAEGDFVLIFKTIMLILGGYITFIILPSLIKILNLPPLYSDVAISVMAVFIISVLATRVTTSYAAQAFVMHTAMPHLSTAYSILWKNINDPTWTPILTALSFIFIGAYWPYWIIFGAKISGSKFAKWLNIIIFLAIFLFLLVPIMKDAYTQRTELPVSQEGLQRMATLTGPTAKEAVQDFITWVTTLPTKTTSLYQRQIDYATGGDYYTGKVDENQEEPLGVYIKDLEPSSPKFDFKEPVTVWGLMYARTIENDIQVNLSCNASKSKILNNGIVSPSRPIKVTTLDEVDISCGFNSSTLPLGTNNVYINALFNFETMSYLRTYFMADHRIRSLRREGVDPLQQYDIIDTNPVAVYTNGPLYVGMETKKPPIGVGENDTVPPRLGITLDNRWEGQVKKFTKIEIHVPEETNLTDCDWNHKFNISDAQEEGYKIYSLSEEGLKNLGTLNDGYKNINCRIGVVDPEGLLGDQPITTKYFKMTAEYVYELSESVPVEVFCADPTSPECKTYQGRGSYSGTNFDFQQSDILYPSEANKKIVEKIIETWHPTILEHTSTYNVPYCLIVGTIAQESGGNVNAVSGTGSTGLMQFIISTARDYGIDRNDPKDSIKGGTLFYRDLLNHFSRYGAPWKYTFSIASYNGGQGTVDKAIQKLGTYSVTWQDVSSQLTPELLKSTGDPAYTDPSFDLDRKIEEIRKHVPRVQGYTMYCEEFMGSQNIVVTPTEDDFDTTSITLEFRKGEEKELDKDKKIKAKLTNFVENKAAYYTITALDRTYQLMTNTTESWPTTNPFIKSQVTKYTNETVTSSFTIANAASINKEFVRYGIAITPTMYQEKRETIFENHLYGFYDDTNNQHRFTLLTPDNKVLCTMFLSAQSPVQTCSAIPRLKATIFDANRYDKIAINIAYEPEPK